MPTAFEVKFRDEVTRSSSSLNSELAAWWTRLNSAVEMVDARLTDGSQPTVPHTCKESNEHESDVPAALSTAGEL